MTRRGKGPGRPNLLREGVHRLRALFLSSEGLHIGENRLVAKKDASGNQDPYWQRQDGTEDNLTGEISVARATSTLTLTTTAQSITGDGDSSKVRLLLPSIGDWLVEAVIDFQVNDIGGGTLVGELFVNDSASAETGQVLMDGADVDRGTHPQRWKVTTTAADTPVEIKAWKTVDAGSMQANTQHTSLSASSGMGGGTATAATDHGGLAGLGDDDHTQYLLAAGTRAGSTGTAQDFGATGIKADVLAESTADAGVTVDGVLDVKGAIIEDTDGTPVGDVLLKVLDERVHFRDEADALLVDAVALRMRLGGVTIDDVVFLRNAISKAAELWKGDFSALGNLLVARQICDVHIRTNTIIENTGGLGVTIDGVLLKDSSIAGAAVPATHSGSAHHAKYTDAEAIAAVKRETHITLAHSVSGVAFSS
ncbi:hypothetical protein LCGC14_0725930 [marine sediment metagenome]|uniref:Uncharacterized protein n=1 Tax=marine sediment metagenome TaxID=412755 RepID=A0A0F9TI65_9ZZZZ